MIEDSEWRKKYFDSNDAKLKLLRTHRITLDNLNKTELLLSHLINKYEKETGKEYEEPSQEELESLK
jgi:hypothetical protein